jgi:hypothetical protein
VTGENINKLKYQVGAIVRQMRNGSYEGPKPKPLTKRVAAVSAGNAAKRSSMSAVNGIKKKAKTAVAKKSADRASAKKQQKSANKKTAQSRRAKMARPAPGRKKATAAKKPKKLSLKQRALKQR